MLANERLRVATPEDIEITVTLSGIGSRFAAALLDMAIQAAILYMLLTIVSLIAAPVGVLSDGVAQVVFVTVLVVGVFVVFFLYHLLFELFWKGRTPGKAALGIYVVGDGAVPPDAAAVVIRNLLRIVDFLPLFYFVGLVSIVCGGKRKRLGDWVAATLVVKRVKQAPGSGYLMIVPRDYREYAGIDSTALTNDDELVLRRFLIRRRQLAPAARRELAHDLASYLAPKIMGPPVGVAGEERFLENLLLARDFAAVTRGLRSGTRA